MRQMPWSVPLCPLTRLTSFRHRQGASVWPISLPVYIIFSTSASPPNGRLVCLHAGGGGPCSQRGPVWRAGTCASVQAKADFLKWLYTSDTAAAVTLPHGAVILPQ